MSWNALLWPRGLRVPRGTSTPSLSKTAPKPPQRHVPAPLPEPEAACPPGTWTRGQSRLGSSHCSRLAPAAGHTAQKADFPAGQRVPPPRARSPRRPRPDGTGRCCWRQVPGPLTGIRCWLPRLQPQPHPDGGRSTPHACRVCTKGSGVGKHCSGGRELQEQTWGAGRGSRASTQTPWRLPHPAPPGRRGGGTSSAVARTVGSNSSQTCPPWVPSSGRLRTQPTPQLPGKQPQQGGAMVGLRESWQAGAGTGTAPRRSKPQDP